MSTQTIPPSSKTRQLLNKVPEVTIYFWIIKCLCTTIGETMSDNLMGRIAVGGDNATPGQLQTALYKVAAITVIVLVVLLAIQPGGWSSAPSPCTLSAPPGGKCSTGWPS
jgi:uncharacterized membrane-anchored protein